MLLAWRQFWQWWTLGSVRGNFYRKSLILVLCITSLPTAVIGVASYIAGRAHIEGEIARNHEALLKKTIDRMHDNFAQLELAATQWSLDSRLEARLRDIKLNEEYNTTQTLYRFLGVMKGAYPLIDRVDLYLDKERPVIVSDIEGVVPITRQQDLMQFQGLLEHERGVFWNDALTKVNARSDEPYLTLVHKLPTIGQPYGALIFYLDKARLVQMVEEMTTDNDGASFLMGRDGHLIVSKPAADAKYMALETAIRAHVLQSGQENGSSLLNWRGQSYTVSFGEFTRLGAHWKYSTATSLTQMTAPVILMSRIMLAVGLFGLLLAFLLSWMASKRIYQPIRHLVNLVKDHRLQPADANRDRDELAFIASQWKHLSQESRQLKSRLEQAYPSLRAAFLMQLVHGHFYSLSEAQLRSRMAGFGWPSEAQWHVLLLVQTSGFAKEDGRFYESEEQLVTFATANIAQEIVHTRSVQSEIINFQDLTIGILLSYSAERTKQQVKEDLYWLADDLVRTVSKLLKMQTTVCIGHITPQVRELPGQLPYLRNAIRYRDLKGDCQVLDLEEMLPAVHNPGMRYPFEVEKELMQVIRMGQSERAMQLIQLFIDELVGQAVSEKLLQEGGLQVLGSMLHTLLETGFHPHLVYGGQNLYEQLNQLREPEQMVRFFQHKVIEPYMQKLNEHQDLHMKQLVEQVTDRIRLRFASDISLEECADAFGVTPFALSKAFKQVHGMNYIDYLIQLRIDKAKELLAGTDLKINEVAEQVGYQPSYFIRLFKKFEDMTPGQYRERSM
ncbi:AraC family transcriptional regulator [Paenibacillus puerhi]|uniref:AraC family transcriptional regulator n=1 Tax=Paenibacillus puerhi TaxID=2692622 RepID=UPI001357A027|nr:AraC family transcriptional regulator [Paenibacillus puerhi]